MAGLFCEPCGFRDQLSISPTQPKMAFFACATSRRRFAYDSYCSAVRRASEQRAFGDQRACHHGCRMLMHSSSGLIGSLSQVFSRRFLDHRFLGGKRMYEIEIALSLVIGFAGGYALRSAISARRRRRVYQLRREYALREIEVARVLATENADTQMATMITLSPSEMP